MSGEFSQHIISISANARQALQQLNDLTEFESRTLFVVDENGKLEGSITDGDIRRGLLAGMEISDKVSRYMNTGSKYFTEDTMKPEKIKQYRNADILLVPFLDERNCIK